MDSSNSGQDTPSAGPTIKIHRAESTPKLPGSTEKTPEPATMYQAVEKVQESSSLRLKSPTPLDGPRGAQNPAGGFFIQNRITCILRVTFERSRDSKLSKVAEEMSVLLHKPESYQEIENEAKKHANALSAKTIGPKELKFSYGNCTIVSSNGAKSRLPLRSGQDWTEVYRAILEYWTSNTHERLHLYISRHYLACQDEPTEDTSFAQLKCLEINDLMKQTWERKDYIPHNVLETVISDQTISWIIQENPPSGLPQDEQDTFVHRVQAEGRILLAMCVDADLGMECLKRLLDRGCKDSNLPLDEDTPCHSECRRKFKTLIEKQGGFRAAHFVEGEHKTLHSSTVVPLYFFSRAQGKDDLDREVTEVCGNEPQNSPSEESAIKRAAWCGFGALSNVYCVKIDPNHHKLSTDLEACFALKEFRDRGQRSTQDFEKELKILQELRLYSHEHIVTHLATWTQLGKHYLLFPFAQCNLREYMKEARFDLSKKEDLIWFLHQVQGMAGAVKHIHRLSGDGGDPPAPSPSLAAPAAPGERKTAWHHDLKPENILHFLDGSTTRGMLRISDWGSGKVNEYRRTSSIHTRSPIGTVTYEPPEATSEGSTSRPYDLWSLGCVDLEFLIWAVFGPAAVTSFSDARKDECSPTAILKDDAFWKKNSGNEYVLRSSVVAQMRLLDETLAKPGAPPFKELLGCVRRMLEIKANKRIKAPELSELLDGIYKTKKVELENARETQLSLIQTDHKSPDWTTRGQSPLLGGSSDPAYTDHFNLSPSDMSPRTSRGQHSRNSSASELIPANAARSRQSSNASTLSVRERRGSHSSANSPRTTEGGT